MTLAKSFRITVSIISLIGLIIPGCTKKNDANSSMLIASAGDDLNVQVGNKVNLNGNGSADLSGNTFEYSWKIILKPASSNAGLENNTTATPSFTPN